MEPISRSRTTPSAVSMEGMMIRRIMMQPGVIATALRNS